MIFKQIGDAYSYWIVSTFGYESAVRIEEIMTSLSTFILGMLAMALISSYFILRLHSIEDFGKSKVKLIRVDHGKKSKMIISITNIWSALEVLLFLSFSPFFTIKRFNERDARRTKHFLVFIEILVVVILIFSILSIFTVLEPI